MTRGTQSLAPETTTERVVWAVAAYSDTEPEQLPPLFDSIDPDALDCLVTSLAAGDVSFPYAGYTVTVESDGSVQLADAGAE